MKKILVVIVSIIIGIGFIYFFNNWEKEEGAEGSSGSQHNVSGWAWSQNIGWISFNCNNSELPAPRCTNNYGVHICTSETDPLCANVSSPRRGKLTGFAWSTWATGTTPETGGIGWIRFDPPPDFVAYPGCGYPSGPCRQACLDLPGTGQVCDGTGDWTLSGWARACAGTANPDLCATGTNPAAGGWDGWIKLRGTTTVGTTYGIFLTTTTDPNIRQFEGWAWGGDDSTSTAVIGWISFNVRNCDVDGDGTYEGSNEGTPAGSTPAPTNCPTSGTAYTYRVMATVGNQPPYPPSTTSEAINQCAWEMTPQCAPGLSITLNWTYSDPDGDPQTAYEVWLDDSSTFPDPKFNNLVTHSPLSGPNFSYALNLTDDDDSPPDWLSQLKWNTTYYWRVRVRDNQGNWSGWSAVDSFTTPLRPSPKVDFSFPPKATVDEVVTFTNKSECYQNVGGVISTTTCATCVWNFGDGKSTTTCETTVTHTYEKSGTYNVSLRITDRDDSTGYTCTSTKTIIIAPKVPWWKEIRPPF